MRIFQRLRGASLMLFVGATGCGAPSAAGGADEQSTPAAEGTVRDELVGANEIALDDYSGIVRIGHLLGNFVSTVCTGVLVNNNTALTPTWCASAAQFVVEGAQATAVSKTMVVGPIAMVRLLTPFMVWDPTHTSAPTVGYHRRIYSGTDASLEGTPTRGVTFPSGFANPPTSSTGIMHSTPGGVGDLDVTSHGNVIITLSDVGTPFFTGRDTDFINADLDAISVGCGTGIPPLCRAVGPEQWYTAVSNALSNGW